MFVVKKTFKNLGKVYTVGSVISEPALIKRFKGKLAEGKIIEVTEQTYNDRAKYFKLKYGVDLPKINSERKLDKPVEKAVEQTVKTEQAAKPSVAKAKATTAAK